MPFYKPKPILKVVEKLCVIFGLFSVSFCGDVNGSYPVFAYRGSTSQLGQIIFFYLILYLFIFSLLACDLMNKHCASSRYEWRLALVFI